MNRARVRAAAVLAAALVLVCTVSPAAVTGEEALDYAFRFATAIESDAKDRGKAQASVVLEMATIGALDAATTRVDQVDGWHRGAAYADLASAFARLGQSGTARELLAKAEAVRDGVDGWHGPRIQAHVAQALALLGDLDQSRSIAHRLAAADRQYVGRSVASVATAHAARGEFEAALAELKQLDENTDLDVSWWRTVGYVALAREDRLPQEQRVRAIEAADRSARGVTGWKQAEALESVAALLRELGKQKSARSALVTAESILKTQPDTLPVKAALLSNLARAWAGLGEAARSRRLLGAAERIVPLAIVIDRPGVLANLASSYVALADDEQAWRFYDAAMAEAEALENSRPRALAAVSICRSMGRSGIELKPETRRRLESLVGGLGEPW